MDSKQIGVVDGVPVHVYRGATPAQAVAALPGTIVFDETEAKFIQASGVRLSPTCPIVRAKRAVPTAYIQRITCPKQPK